MPFEHRCKNPEQNTINQTQQAIKRVIHHNQVESMLGKARVVQHKNHHKTPD